MSTFEEFPDLYLKSSGFQSLKRASDANPLASLFNRLTKDAPLVRTPTDESPREIVVGELRLTVHPSYAAYQTRPASR